MKFIESLKEYNAKGYHKYNSYDVDINLLFKNNNFNLNSQYLNFIREIGYGSFFDGGLVFFRLEGKNSIISLTKKLKQKEYIVIGYDGTTEGYFCLRNDEKDKSIYWFNIQLKTIEKLNDDFSEWLNIQQKELFNDKIYAGFKSIKDIDRINTIIRERSKIKIELLDYNKKLVKPPGKENDFLPRYNKLVFSIYKNEEIPNLKDLTIKVFRKGSSVGNDNIDYVTIDISTIKIHETKIINAYSFDAFNVPFLSIECVYNPKINLESKMRVRFKEIKKFL